MSSCIVVRVCTYPQSTWEAIEEEPRLVVIDFCNANRHRSVAKGTIMSCMLVEKGIEHGLLHLNGMKSWKYMRCGGSCSSCGDVDQGRAKGLVKLQGQDGGQRHL